MSSETGDGKLEARLAEEGVRVMAKTGASQEVDEARVPHEAAEQTGARPSRGSPRSCASS
jgi:hypothetical protein